MKAINLKTEYLINPAGIDITKPRLFWSCEGGIEQTAYCISAVDGDGNELWNSGKVESSAMTHIVWGGSAVNARTKVIWKVKLWDEKGKAGEWSEPAAFETGIDQWKAKWICGDYRVNKRKRYPVDCFRRSFGIDRKVKSARLYITACGIYEARLNNSRVGNFVLAPGHTDYRKRIQYQTYDVTGLIEAGENILSVELADGWYRGSTGAWGLRNQYGTKTKLIAQLEIKFTDGTNKEIVTDGNWQWSNDGPVRFADNKDGEIVDANRRPSYSKAAAVTECAVVPRASNNVFITEHEVFKPQKSISPSGKIILDFRQNIAGYIEFKVNATGGEKITLRFGEMLDKSGELTLKNIQCVSKKITTPLQKVEYSCKKGENTYKTKFAIFGFQYAEVDTTLEISPDDFTAIAVYSDLEETGSFDSSNRLLNQFVKNTMWSLKNNSADVPTDCPTRERHGWTGDSQIFCESAGYLMNYIPFARKHLNDVFDWQRKDGCLPQIAPSGGVDFYMYTLNGSVGWADAGVLIPYRYWKLFGDDGLIKDNYDNMARYARFMMKRCGKFGLMAKPLGLKGDAKKYAVNSGQSYGEWAEPAEVHPNDWKDMVAPHPEVSTAYTSYIMSLMTEIAEFLEKPQDAELYRRYAEKCKLACQALVETKAYSLDTDRQAQLVRPLFLKLLSEKQKEFAKKRLVKAMENFGWRIGTGFLSTPFILYVLADIDTGYAYRLLENEEMPGWLYMPKNGATTIWESWEGTSAQGGIASLNHYSKGACCEWLFKEMCGINVDGKNHFIIAPKPGGHFSFAKAEYKSVFGTVKSGWEIKNGETVFHITVPANTTADIVLPDGTKRTVTAGEYTF
ncbi:MAG: family 78 glycoside hydrolase catalytic domain [Clostridiales bacterium]|nr:family 78 glycoside hydrolase catalytic domain [Clostridiales bacterium]